MVRKHADLYVWFTIALACLLFHSSTAFNNAFPGHRVRLTNDVHRTICPHNRCATELHMRDGGFFDNIGRFFDDFGRKNEDNEKIINDFTGGESDVEQQLEDYLGSSLIFHIEAETMKVGGLRLLIFLLMMGLLNDPEKKTWKANQKDDNMLEMFFNDATGAIIVQFVEDVGMSVYRFGSSPSMQYMMQESRILQAILDELDTIVNEGDVKDDDRLLILKDKENILKARDTISFG